MNDLKQAVLDTYNQYLEYFLCDDLEGINSLVEYPITHIGVGEVVSYDRFPLKPSEMRMQKGWHTSIGVKTEVSAVNETKAHVISSGTRVRQDGSIIEHYSAFYAFVKRDEGWKMFAICDVVNA